MRKNDEIIVPLEPIYVTKIGFGFLFGRTGESRVVRIRGNRVTISTDCGWTETYDIDTGRRVNTRFASGYNLSRESLKKIEGYVNGWYARDMARRFPT